MESVFQFSNPELVKLDFKINDNFESSGSEQVKIKVKMETQVDREENSDDAIVRLCVTVGAKTNKSPFYVHAEEASRFRWEKGTYNEEQINTLLKQNAPALLLSYLRPIIAGITGSSRYSAYDIPFMNFRESR